MKSLLALMVRIPLYLFFFWLSFFVVIPSITPEILAMLLAMPLASLAVFLDILLTSKIKGKRVEEVISSRIVAVDRLLAPEGERIADKRRLSTREAKPLPEERVQLSHDRSSETNQILSDYSDR